MDINPLIASLTCVIIGLAYFSYGRKQNVLFMLAGIALLVIPYFIGSVRNLMIAGGLIAISPIVLSRLL